MQEWLQEREVWWLRPGREDVSGLWDHEGRLHDMRCWRGNVERHAERLDPPHPHPLAPAASGATARAPTCASGAKKKLESPKKKFTRSLIETSTVGTDLLGANKKDNSATENEQQLGGGGDVSTYQQPKLMPNEDPQGPYASSYAGKVTPVRESTTEVVIDNSATKNEQQPKLVLGPLDKDHGSPTMQVLRDETQSILRRTAPVELPSHTKKKLFARVGNWFQKVATVCRAWAPRFATMHARARCPPRNGTRTIPSPRFVPKVVADGTVEVVDKGITGIGKGLVGVGRVVEEAVDLAGEGVKLVGKGVKVGLKHIVAAVIPDACVGKSTVEVTVKLMLGNFGDATEDESIGRWEAAPRHCMATLPATLPATLHTTRARRSGPFLAIAIAGAEEGAREDEQPVVDIGMVTAPLRTRAHSQTRALSTQNPSTLPPKGDRAERGRLLRRGGEGADGLRGHPQLAAWRGQQPGQGCAHAAHAAVPALLCRVCGGDGARPTPSPHLPHPTPSTARQNLPAALHPPPLPSIPAAPHTRPAPSTPRTPAFAPALREQGLMDIPYVKDVPYVDQLAGRWVVASLARPCDFKYCTGKGTPHDSCEYAS